MIYADVRKFRMVGLSPKGIRPRLRPLSWASIAETQDLDGRACEDGIVQSHVWLGDLNAYGLHRGVLFQDRGGHPFGYRLGQVDGRPVDDLRGPLVDFAGVHRSRQVIGAARRPQVETQLDVY